MLGLMPVRELLLRECTVIRETEKSTEMNSGNQWKSRGNLEIS